MIALLLLQLCSCGSEPPELLRSVEETAEGLEPGDLRLPMGQAFKEKAAGVVEISVKCGQRIMAECDSTKQSRDHVICVELMTALLDAARSIHLRKGKSFWRK